MPWTALTQSWQNLQLKYQSPRSSLKHQQSSLPQLRQNISHLQSTQLSPLITSHHNQSLKFTPLPPPFCLPHNLSVSCNNLPTPTTTLQQLFPTLHSSHQLIMHQSTLTNLTTKPQQSSQVLWHITHQLAQSFTINSGPSYNILSLNFHLLRHHYHLSSEPIMIVTFPTHLKWN